MQDLLHKSVRELEQMKDLALQMASTENSKELTIEEIAEHFDEIIKIKSEEFWDGLISCNEGLSSAKDESSSQIAYDILKSYLDKNVLFFSEGSESFNKFSMIYENFYSAVNDMEGDVTQEGLEEALKSMLNDITQIDNLEDIAQLRNAVSSLEDLEAKNLLLEALAKREAALLKDGVK